MLLSGKPVEERTESHALYDAFYFKDRKSTRLNSSHVSISYAVFCSGAPLHLVSFPTRRSSDLCARGGGESFSSARKCSRSAVSPSRTPSSPAEVFCTHPLICCSPASRWRKGRNPTPCTMPSILKIGRAHV